MGFPSDKNSNLWLLVIIELIVKLLFEDVCKWGAGEGSQLGFCRSYMPAGEEVLLSDDCCSLHSSSHSPGRSSRVSDPASQSF